MPDETPDSNNQSRAPKPPGGQEPQFNWRGLLLFAVAFALIGGAFLFRGSSIASTDEITLPKFESLLKEGKIVSTAEKPLELVIEEGRNTQTLSGYYRKKTAASTEEIPTPFKTAVYMPFNGTTLEKELAAAGITPNVRSESNMVATTILNILPIALFLVVLYFFFRSQIKMAGKGAMNFGKSKAKMLAREKNKITFKDVAGVEEAKEEVQELVDFLKDPKKFQKLGGRIPKGVLMVGSPGTGKTLLARAIAGEADVPFFNISGSDFVEMFVGVGASRVRDMFEQGRKNAPCLIFIDEIDAVGRHRGHGVGGGHDEREQTLNQLLVEMDGFDAQDGVIIIAATNRPDVLDPALLRPGRFDRQVTVGLPDVKGREEILRVHSKKVKLSESVDLSLIARGTPGYSGAELANVINEAALMAARKGQKAIEHNDLEEARDKVRWGKERRSLAMSEKEKISTAWHEAGHALLTVILDHAHPLHKVTIIPRGQALGSTMYLPEGDKYSTQRKEALAMLVMTMGGRIAEEMFTGDVSNGASGDIAQATKLARRMVCEWGMSSLGMIRFSEDSEYVFLGRDAARGREYSEETARQIDSEVKRLIDDAYRQATEMLEARRDKVKLIAEALLEFETLEGSQIQDLIELGHMRNPPVIAQNPPPLPPPPTGTGTTEAIKPSEPDYPAGGLAAPVPA
ncbi:MAG: ATP-dependent metallopeptidase FtsH/Yme1/Tma family protein [Proteobacteria bacterium]|nr:ATP-dependent metallopeptidase FtsH/Yme1/Tma family protein [Pseudomonadota bacterium]